MYKNYLLFIGFLLFPLCYYHGLKGAAKPQPTTKNQTFVETALSTMAAQQSGQEKKVQQSYDEPLQKQSKQEKENLVGGVTDISISQSFAAEGSLEKELPLENKITRVNCGGAISPHLSAISSDEDELACMEAGFKKIRWIKFSPKVDSLRKKIGIQEMRIKHLSSSDSQFLQDFIYYTPEGKKEALLFKEYKRKHLFSDIELENMSHTEALAIRKINDYLQGYLLGYPEDNIRLYYENKHILFKFAADKKQALEWIEVHKKIDLEKKHTGEDALKKVERKEE